MIEFAVGNLNAHAMFTALNFKYPSVREVTVTRLIIEMTLATSSDNRSFAELPVLAIGVGIVSSTAFVAGVGAIIDPDQDWDHDSWLINQYVTPNSLSSDSTGENDTIDVKSYRWDLRSQRVMNVGESELVFVVVNLSDTIECSYNMVGRGLLRFRV